MTAGMTAGALVRRRCLPDRALRHGVCARTSDGRAFLRVEPWLRQPTIGLQAGATSITLRGRFSVPADHAMFNASPARACGIDFGTSNSTVGWWRPDVDPLIALEGDQPTLPSVVFFNLEERRPVYGRQALDEYLEGYEGRLMRSLKSLLGSKLLKSETTVLGSAMPFKDILGLFLGTLKQRAEAAAGRPFEEVAGPAGVLRRR